MAVRSHTHPSSLPPPISTPQAAAYKIFELIDRTPAIDVNSEAGVKRAAADMSPRIEFRNVTFAYPSRPDEVSAAACRSCSHAASKP